MSQGVVVAATDAPLARSAFREQDPIGTPDTEVVRGLDEWQVCRMRGEVHLRAKRGVWVVEMHDVWPELAERTLQPRALSRRTQHAHGRRGVPGQLRVGTLLEPHEVRRLQELDLLADVAVLTARLAVEAVGNQDPHGPSIRRITAW